MLTLKKSNKLYWKLIKWQTSIDVMQNSNQELNALRVFYEVCSEIELEGGDRFFPNVLL